MEKEFTGEITHRTVVAGTPAKTIDFSDIYEHWFVNIIDPDNDIPVGATVKITWKENGQ